METKGKESEPGGVGQLGFEAMSLKSKKKIGFSNLKRNFS